MAVRGEIDLIDDGKCHVWRFWQWPTWLHTDSITYVRLTKTTKTIKKEIFFQIKVQLHEIFFFFQHNRFELSTASSRKEMINLNVMSLDAVTSPKKSKECMSESNPKFLKANLPPPPSKKKKIKNEYLIF